MLYIVIPVFNRKEFTRNCLISLCKQSYRNFKVIIVDDGSTDGTSEMISAEFPEIEVLTGDGSLWWTASVNLGISRALEEDATYILTLNNDTVAKEDFLENMILSADQCPKSMIGALAVDFYSKQPIYGGGLINWKTATIRPLLERLAETDRQGLHVVDHFPGRGLLIPRDVVSELGLFNEKVFPHYFADFDFTHQAVKKGVGVFCNYNAILYTFPEESGDRKNRRRRTLKNYYLHLFGIKGGGNLRNFTFFAIRNCPFYYLPSYLLLGYFRRVFGYFLNR